jgi:hypothetical protein
MIKKHNEPFMFGTMHKHKEIFWTMDSFTHITHPDVIKELPFTHRAI